MKLYLIICSCSISETLWALANVRLVSQRDLAPWWSRKQGTADRACGKPRQKIARIARGTENDDALQRSRAVIGSGRGLIFADALGSTDASGREIGASLAAKKEMKARRRPSTLERLDTRHLLDAQVGHPCLSRARSPDAGNRAFIGRHALDNLMFCLRVGIVSSPWCCDALPVAENHRMRSIARWIR